MEFNILKATKEDLEAILALQKEAYQSEAILYHNPHIPPLTQTLQELQEEFSKGLFLKAIYQDTIVGSLRASCEQDVCKIGKLIVHPMLQRKGIGTALMHHIEALFVDVSRYELFTGSKSQNNIRLYQHLGYRIFKYEEITPELCMVFLEKQAPFTSKTPH